MATPHMYANGMLNVMNGGIDLDTNSFKLELLTSAYTPAQGTHAVRSDLGANEATGGTGYPAGGFTVSTPTLAIATLTVNWDAADISQAIVGGPFAFRYGAFYKVVGTAATDLLVAYVDFGAQSVTDATLNITLTNQIGVTVA
jgi:hypothetical protein